MTQVVMEKYIRSEITCQCHGNGSHHPLPVLLEKVPRPRVLKVPTDTGLVRRGLTVFVRRIRVFLCWSSVEFILWIAIGVSNVFKILTVYGVRKLLLEIYLKAVLQRFQIPVARGGVCQVVRGGGEVLKAVVGFAGGGELLDGMILGARDGRRSLVQREIQM